MIRTAHPAVGDTTEPLLSEARELHLIFNAIIKKASLPME